MNCILELHKSSGVVKPFASIGIINGKPLFHNANIYFRLPYTNPELCADKRLKILYLGKISHRYKFDLGIISIGICRVHYRILLIGICYLSEELAPCSHKLDRMYLFWLQVRIATFKGETVDIIHCAVKVCIAWSLCFMSITH